MNIEELVEISECPHCGGGAILEEECGCHSVNIDFKSEDERLGAARRTAELWNCGKVISSEPGE